MNWKSIGTTAAAVIILALVAPSRSPAKPPPSLKGPVATVGERTVEAIDIERAGQALSADPPPGISPRAWRRTLLNRCVDRELLAMEAARLGWPDSADVREKIEDRWFGILMPEVFDKVLVPGVVPSPEEFARIKASRLYDYVDLDYILVRDDESHRLRALADKIATRARAGVAWDSMAKLHSGHPPSAAGGGHLGVAIVKDLEPLMYEDFRTAKPGDVLGPYSGPYGHDIFKVRGWVDVGDDSTLAVVVFDRTRRIIIDHEAALLKKYHFDLDTLQARHAITALATEPPGNLLATLGPDGTRPARGTRRALGAVARVDGDSVTVADILRRAHLRTNAVGVIRVRNEEVFAGYAARAILRRLVIRDALERGIDKTPEIARRLRLERDRAATIAMVEQARPPDPSAEDLRVYIEQHASRYSHPVSRRARVMLFADVDSARAALKTWNGVGVPDSTERARWGLHEKPRPDLGDILPWRTVDRWFDENGVDPISVSLRGLDAGQFAPVTKTPLGWAVSCVLERREPRPMTEEEAAPRALRDWREEAENRWVVSQLERLRAKTAVKIVPARLDAVRIRGAGEKVGAGS